MNNIDKNFVFDISQGLSRRFTFIEILPPEEEYFEDEVRNVKILSQKRVKEKVASYGDTSVNDAFFGTIDGSAAFSAAENNLVELLRHIRYTRSDDASYLGLAIGTAQIIDIFETAYISLIVGEYSLNQMNKDGYLSIFDSVVASRIIPQMDGFDYMKLNSFYASISEKPEFSCFQKTKRTIYKFIH
jgi:hypothetical protein